VWSTSPAAAAAATFRFELGARHANDGRDRIVQHVTTIFRRARLRQLGLFSSIHSYFFQ